MADEHKVNVVFSPETYRALEEIARRLGKTLPEALGAAIAREKWFQETVDSGQRVLVSKDNNLFDVTTPSLPSRKAS